MLHIFQVNTGHMLHFDIAFTSKSVGELKTQIELQCGIPKDEQSLLIDGGICLMNDSLVASYQAGTDISPIFLVSMVTEEEKGTATMIPPPAFNINNDDDDDLNEMYREVVDLPPSYDTVLKRTSLAQMFHDRDKHQKNICEQLVEEQRLQQRGWLVIIANLEDFRDDLQRRFEFYRIAFNDYLAKRDSYIYYLTHFKDNIKLLQNIPVLPILLKGKQKTSDKNEANETDKEIVSLSTSNPTEDDHVNALFDEDVFPDVLTSDSFMSLYDWISRNDYLLDNLYDVCADGLSQLDQVLYDGICSKIDQVFSSVDNDNMKSIGGLSERLSLLVQTLAQLGEHVKEQDDQAQAFLHNKMRASTHNEPSIWPDLCASHLQQMQIILKNHSLTRDLSRRIGRSKIELCQNIQSRLQWLVHLQNQLINLDDDLVFSSRKLKNLQMQLEIVKQVHNAPQIYLTAVSEVVRRRNFSQSFLMWSSELACRLLTVHNEELTRRKDFQAQLDSHFLAYLFPGFDDMPPSFATQAPSIFDSGLPRIMQEDIDQLSSLLPDDHLRQILMHSYSNMHWMPFVREAIQSSAALKINNDIDRDQRICNVNNSFPDKEMEIMRVVMEGAGLPISLTDRTLLDAIDDITGRQHTPITKISSNTETLIAKTDELCESETDTEGFEKVTSSSKIPTHDNTVYTGYIPCLKIKDEAQSLSQKIEYLKSGYLKMYRISRNVISDLKMELKTVRNDLHDYQEHVKRICFSLDLAMKAILQTHGDQIREMTSTHDRLLSDLQEKIRVQDKEIEESRIHTSSLNERISALSSENEALQHDLNKTRDSASKEVVNAREECKREMQEEVNHWRSEVTSVRARYKLLLQQANVGFDRIPSEDNSLVVVDVEGANQGSVVNIGSNSGSIASAASLSNVLLNQSQLNELQQQFEFDKAQAVEEEQVRFQESLELKIRSIEEKHRMELAEYQKRWISDLQQERESMGQQLQNLTAQCLNYRHTISKLLESDRLKDSYHLSVKSSEGAISGKVKCIPSSTMSQKTDDSDETSRSFSISSNSNAGDSNTGRIQHLESFVKDEDSGTASMLILHSPCTSEVNKATLSPTDSPTTTQIRHARSPDLLREKNMVALSGSMCLAPLYQITSHSESSVGSPNFKLPKINVSSCSRPGDVVLIIWEPIYQNYVVFQQCSYIYFLHADSHKELGLEVNNGIPNCLVTLAEITSKEHCQVRRSGNRFNIPTGTRFFRIRARRLRDPRTSHLPIADLNPKRSKPTAAQMLSISPISSVSLLSSTQNVPASSSLEELSASADTSTRSSVYTADHTLLCTRGADNTEFSTGSLLSPSPHSTVQSTIVSVDDQPESLYISANFIPTLHSPIKEEQESQVLVATEEVSALPYKCPFKSKTKIEKGKEAIDHLDDIDSALDRYVNLCD